MTKRNSQKETLTAEKKLFKENVQKFVRQEKQKQKKLENENRRNDQSIVELIANAGLLSTESVDNFFKEKHNFIVPEKTVAQVRNIFDRMRNKINRLSPIKRFYILETMDFFNSKISIGKLIPILLLLDGLDQKRAIFEFIRPTFLSLNKNIETLAATDSIFNASSIHIERGSLYAFVADIAKVLCKLFKQEFHAQHDDVTSPVEMMLRIFRNSLKNKEKQLQGMVDEERILRQVVLEFVITIQAHDSLYSYSLKRHSYYKLFLSKLTQRGKFPDIDAYDVSCIFAGCLLANDQMRPDDKLIDGMTNPETFATKEVIRARHKFINQLAPSAVFKLINEIKAHMQKLSKKGMDKEFRLVDNLSVKNVLKKVWTGFVRLVEVGLSAAAKPFVAVLDQIRDTFFEYVAEDDEDFPKTSKELAEENLTARDVYIIPKEEYAITVIQQVYTFVETDIGAFRGDRDGASLKDYGYNARMFQQDEATMREFQKCFVRLFESLKMNNKVKEIIYKKQRNIQEYYTCLKFDQFLVAVGITHVKNPNSEMIQEKEMFPYVLLFCESSTKEFGRVLSREVNDDGSVTIYNETSFSATNSIYFYESLLCLLHMLPEKDWNARDSQVCIRFLTQELQKIQEEGKELNYLMSLPPLQED